MVFTADEAEKRSRNGEKAVGISWDFLGFHGIADFLGGFGSFFVGSSGWNMLGFGHFFMDWMVFWGRIWIEFCMDRGKVPFVWMGMIGGGRTHFWIMDGDVCG